MVDARASVAVWQSVRSLPAFCRLLELRVASQFADGLFQAALAGALLFSLDRATDAWGVAAAAAVLFLPYSMVGPFAGALLDRWDRRWVLVGANLGRLILVIGVAVLLATGAHTLVVLCAALLVNGCTRFVASGLSAALPHVVPREQVITMNSVAAATGGVATTLGAVFMLLPRYLFGADDAGAAAILCIAAVPVALALLLAVRFAPRVLGPDDTPAAIHGSAFYAVATGWVHGARTVVRRPTVLATLSGLAAHRMVFGINTLLVLVSVRHTDVASMRVAGLGSTVLFTFATGVGLFLAIVATPAAVRRWGRYATTNAALAAAAVIQLCAIGVQFPVLVVCGLLLGTAGQVVKLCADSAMQMDVDDALRGHVFAVQDSLFWIAFVAAITAAAGFIAPDGHSPALVATGVVLYLAGLIANMLIVGARLR